MATTQRKRVGRTSKTANTKQNIIELPTVDEKVHISENINQAISEMDNKNKIDVDGAAVALSSPSTKPATEVAAAPTIIGECRRSSRKKIIKFDVRDLLNKHRKPHKIQIEARIDSNAPQPSTTPTLSTAVIVGGNNAAGGSSAALSTSSELSSKQKAFMEKSAIFRRMSISEQQNKIPVPPLPPPLTPIPKIDEAKIAQARRLSRTQEIFNASLMKSKQNSSLIVAQIESNSTSSSSSSGIMTQACATLQPAQRKTTTTSSKRSSVSNTLPLPTLAADLKNVTPDSGVQKRRGRGVKNKSPSANNNPKKLNQKQKQENKESNEQQQNVNIVEGTNKLGINKSTPNTATNWKEYKASLAKSNETLESNVQKRFQLKKKKTTQSEDEILELSSTSSMSEHNYRTKSNEPTDGINETQETNFASISIWQNNSNICATGSELIVAAVEEIVTESVQIEQPSAMENKISTPKIVNQSKELSKNASTTSSSTLYFNKEMSPISPVQERGSSGGRKSSGSESESGSDRSNKSYKKGDKLRVSLKRMSLPEHVSTSSTSIPTSPSASNSSSDVIVGDINKNSFDSNVSSNTESSSLAANKALPTRRSNRFSLKNPSTKASDRQNQLNDNLNKVEHKLTDVEKKSNALPFDLNASNTALQTDTQYDINKGKEGKKEEEENEIKSKGQFQKNEETQNKNQDSSMGLSINEEASTSSNIYDDIPSKLHENKYKKEPITLPLKKQVSKFKMYEAAVQDVVANVETSTLLDILNTVKQNDLSTTNSTKMLETPATRMPEQLAIQTNVGEQEKMNVKLVDSETSKTADIPISKAFEHPTEVNIDSQDSESPFLFEGFPTDGDHESKTDDVQPMTDVALEIEIEFDGESTLAKNSTQSILNFGSQCVSIKEKNREESHPSVSTYDFKTTASTTSLDNMSQEFSVSPHSEESVSSDLSSEKILDDSSSEGISSKREQPKVGGKKTPSPTPSGSGKSRATNKPIRRNERRSQRGNISVHKTLEETFAEIAAESSKAVLNLKAKNIDMSHDENVKLNVPETAELEENLECNVPISKPDLCTMLEVTDSMKSGELTCLTPNTEEYPKNTVVDMTEEGASAEGSLGKSDTSLSDILNVENDVGTNSNQSSPPPRGRKQKNKKETKKSPVVSPTTVTVDKNASAIISENEPKMFENEIVPSDNIVVGANCAITKTVEPQDLPPVAQEVFIMEEMPGSEIEKISEKKKKRPSGGKQIDEQVKEISSGLTDETEAILVPVNVGDQQEKKIDNTKNYKIQLPETIDTPQEEFGSTTTQSDPAEKTPTKQALNSSMSDEYDMMDNSNTKLQNENLNAPPHKSRKQKRRSPKLQKSVNIDLETKLGDINKTETEMETKNNETDQVSHKVDHIKPEPQNFKPQKLVKTESKAKRNETDKLMDQGGSTKSKPHSSKHEKPKTEVKAQKTETSTALEEVEAINLEQYSSQRRNSAKHESKAKRTETAAPSKTVKTEAKIMINEFDKMRYQSQMTSPETDYSKIEKSSRIETEADGSAIAAVLEEIEATKQKSHSSKLQKSTKSKLEEVKYEAGKSIEEQKEVLNPENIQNTTNDLTTNVEAETENTSEQQLAHTKPQCDKSIKVKKSKTSKSKTEDKSILTTQSAEETTNVETKEKITGAEDATPSKIRKSRKGKHSPELNKVSGGFVSAENETSPNSVNAINPSESVVEKESLAKAPPKKRLLKMQLQLENETSAGNARNSSELATVSSHNNAPNDSNKPPKESIQKKAKKETKVSDETGRVTSFDYQTEYSLDEETRSANSTPIVKQFKQQKDQEKTPEDKTKSSSKRKSKWDQPPVSAEKIEINNAQKQEKDSSKSSTPTQKKEKKIFLGHEDATSQELAKAIEERSAKKKRQKKLKEAFEAALKDALNKQQNQNEITKDSVTVTVTAEQTNITNKEEEQKPDETKNVSSTTTTAVTTTTTAFTTTTTAITASVIDEINVINKMPQNAAMVEPEDDPDPLKDIEKFIEDGVNLLKRGYKIEDDSVDEVICPTKTLLKPEEFNIEVDNAKKENEEEREKTILREGMITPNESLTDIDITTVEKSFEDSNTEITVQNLYYDTPADTPGTTPTTTPPPKSPTNDSSIEEISGVRRSHRIKFLTKTPKALVGRGLVREKERFSIKDDVEMKTHYSLDDHLTDLAQVEAKNAKFLKEMEERLSNFQVIKENEYKCERVVSREARKMVCDCFLTTEEEERGELGCGEDCLNRLLMIECGPDCNVKDRCTNNRFQKLLCSPCRVFRTEKKGFGIMADIEILPGEFIMEYVGEVINGDEFENRRTVYSLDKNRHYYFMALRSDAIIDATIKGNISRFINHSCDPNAETQKWTVNGELRIGFFSRKSIMPGEEITFDYQYQRYGREAQRCYCESANCRGWIGEEPNSDEGEQIDEDSDAMADVSDEDDSDDSTADADDINKKFDIDSSAGNKQSIHTDEDGKLKIDEKLYSALKDKRKREDIEGKLKKLTGKLATDKASRKKRKIKENKAKRMRAQGAGDPTKTLRYLEDPDIEDEVKFLSRGGLRNQSDTLRFSRLVVRAKLSQTRLNLLKILRNAELPCRRLFLDYHGLRLLHGWMSEDGGDMAIRLALLEALESLPITNKTVLTDSKVYQSVRNWCGTALPSNIVPTGSSSSPSDESSKESTNSNSMQQETASPSTVAGGDIVSEVPSELQKLAVKLTTTWNSLPEIFRIPKRERIEQMKEHEREADRQYAEASVDSKRSYTSDRYHRDRFGRGGPATSRYSKPSFSKDSRNISIVGSTSTNDPRRRSAQDNNNSANNESMKHLSKEQRRELFAAKVARDEAEKRLAEERREFETKCRFFGLDPKKTRPQDVPFCVDPSTGQWFSVNRQPIPTPPCYAHIQVHPKPKSTDPADYKLPSLISALPPQWKFAITTLGQIYYYHYKQRIPQWNPPTAEQLRAATEEADSTDSSESCEEAKLINESSEEDEIFIGMDEAKLKAYIDKKTESRRNKRYNRLVDERPISPRKEEDRIYNQMEMRKYKENKEKIRKRKEEIRRKRSETFKSTAAGLINPNGSGENVKTDVIVEKFKNAADADDPDDAIPIQDYLLSSDEEEIMKAECNNSPLLEKIVQGDKIVDELDALTIKRSLKRSLPPHRDMAGGQSNVSGSSSSGAIAAGGSSSSGGASEHKRRKSDKKEKSKKSKESDSKYRRNKEKFRCEIAGIIVQHLKPYRKESCALGRIQSDEDFNHLARKLTHFVMVKELKYCEAVGQTLIVTESVKNKSREFIKKYMAKYGGLYVKPINDPEFKDIPFTI